MIWKFWIQLRSSLWFVPALLVLAGIALALGLVELDIRYADQLIRERWKPLLNAGSDGARGMLTAIASSMITVAGVAFSVTIVTLSLASTQYTPRILRNFMRDRANQFVLGSFVAIFTYCLIVLRTIRASDDGAGFVPLIAVAVAMLLALFSIGCLIFFIHHVATSIQASTILKSIADETSASIDSLFPHQLGEEESITEAAPELQEVTWIPVLSKATGYLQYVDPEGLFEFAEKHDVLVRLERVPGDFVGEGFGLASTNQPLDEAKLAKLRRAFVVGEFRTVEQDTAFGLRQIVDIAMKALSPGINDTSTAVSSVQYLSALLCRLGDRHIESPFRSTGGRVRIIAPRLLYEDFLAKAFDEVRLSALENVTILGELLRTLTILGQTTRSSERRLALLEQARVTAEAADHSVAAPYDRRHLDELIGGVRVALGVGEHQLPGLSATRETSEW